MPFPLPGDLPDSEIEPTSPALQWILYPMNHQKSPKEMRMERISYVGVKALPLYTVASKVPPRNPPGNPRSRIYEPLGQDTSFASKLRWFWEKVGITIWWLPAAHLPWVISPTYSSCSFLIKWKNSLSVRLTLSLFISLSYKTLIYFFNRDHLRQIGTYGHPVFSD